MFHGESFAKYTPIAEGPQTVGVDLQVPSTAMMMAPTCTEGLPQSAQLCSGRGHATAVEYPAGQPMVSKS